MTARLIIGLLMIPLPGLLAWRRGRALLERRGTATFPEALSLHRGQVAGSCALIAVACSFLLGTVPAAPAVILLTLAGAWPARRAIFSESLSFAGWVLRIIRNLLGMAGFLVLLLLTPPLVLSAGPSWWVAGSAASVLLLVWLLRWTRWAPAILGAEPLPLPPLLAAVLERSEIDRLRVYRLGDSTWHSGNAFAMPSLTGDPAVVLGHTLLEALTEAEAAAVFAHELAHVEEHRRRRARGRNLAAGVLLALLVGLALPAVLRFAGLGPGAGWIAALTVLVGVLAALIRRRGHELHCDLRAVDLIEGDGEALVRALEQVYRINHIPRRLGLSGERGSTHPSLNNRIRAVRVKTAELRGEAPGEVPSRDGSAADRPPAGDRAGVPPGSTDSPITVVRGARSGEAVIFGPELLHHLTGLPEDLLATAREAAPPARIVGRPAQDPESDDAVPDRPADGSSPSPRWADLLRAAQGRSSRRVRTLTELRLQPTGKGVLLHVVEQGGARWNVPLDLRDEAAAGAALDRIDTLLAPAEPNARGTELRSAGVFLRAVGLIFALSAIVGIVPLGLILPCLMLLGRPSRNTAVALTVAFLFSGVLVLSLPSGWIVPWYLGGQVALLLLGVGILVAVFSRWAVPERPPHRVPRALGAVLLAVALLAFILPLSVAARDGLSSSALHQAFRGAPAASLLGLSGAVLLLTLTRSSSLRLLLLVVALLSLAPGVIGSRTFARCCLADPLRADALGLDAVFGPGRSAEQLDRLAELERIPLDGWWEGLELGPESGDIALMRPAAGESYYSEEFLFVLGKPPRERARFTARSARFSGPGELLLLRSEDPGGVRVRRVEIDDERGIVVDIAATRLDSDGEIRLAAGPAPGDWSASLWTPGAELIGRASGSLRPVRSPSDPVDAPGRRAVRLDRPLSFEWSAAVLPGPGEGLTVINPLTDPLEVDGFSDGFLPGVSTSELIVFGSDSPEPALRLRSSFELSCTDPLGPEQQTACLADDGDRAHLWTVSSGRELTPRCVLPGSGGALRPGPGGRYTWNAEGRQWLVELVPERGCALGRLPFPEGCLYVQDLRVSPHGLYALAECDDRMQLIRFAAP